MNNDYLEHSFIEGYTPKSKYKYVAKVAEFPYTRYFYSQEEYQRYLQGQREKAISESRTKVSKKKTKSKQVNYDVSLKDFVFGGQAAKDVRSARKDYNKAKRKRDRAQNKKDKYQKRLETLTRSGKSASKINKALEKRDKFAAKEKETGAALRESYQKLSPALDVYYKTTLAGMAESTVKNGLNKVKKYLNTNGKKAAKKLNPTLHLSGKKK